jgi:glycosyltransferase involved in cell wall biosynthesis
MIASQARFFSQRQYAVTVCCNKLSRGTRSAFGDVTVQHRSRLTNLLTPRARRKNRFGGSIRKLCATHPGILIDHEPFLESAEISYVHNFLAPEYADRMEAFMPRENDLARLWEKTSGQHLIVANSKLVKQGLVDLFALPETRIKVIYPGYDPTRFSLETRDEFRQGMRKRLGISDDIKLVGLITSGAFYKRGLDRFLDCIEQLKQTEPTLKALVLGGKKCPAVLKSHPLLHSRDVIYQCSTFAPEHYFAALDILLFPARYEEFGIVILESMAMGVPVVTSAAVGASEILGNVSPQCVIDISTEETDRLCRRAAQLLQLSSAELADLGQALSQEAARYTHEAHNEQLARWVDRFARVAPLLCD